MKPFFAVSRSLMLCAMLSGGAAHALEIVVGQVAPLSGLEANQGRSYSTGMQLFFNQVNKAGGVNGHTFTLVRKDDGGDPKETLAATRKLLAESRPMVLAGFLGGAGLAEITSAGLLESEKIALVGYRAPQLRLDSPFIFSVRASLEDEIRKITGHLATVGIQRLALLVEAGLGEAELTSAMETAVKQSGGKIIAKGNYPAGSTNVRKVVEAFASAQPQAIILIASGAASAAFIEQVQVRRRYGPGVRTLRCGHRATVEAAGRRADAGRSHRSGDTQPLQDIDKADEGIPGCRREGREPGSAGQLRDAGRVHRSTGHCGSRPQNGGKACS